MAGRWSVVLVDLGSPIGSEQGGQRPVLIVSNDDWNQAMRTLTVLPMTTTRRKLYPGEVVVPPGAGGQPQESIVMAHQIRTISKDRVVKEYGAMGDPELRARVSRAILEHLDLDRAEDWEGP